MISRMKDFESALQIEQEGTLKVLNALTPESLSQQVTPDGRSLGFLAWHLVTLIHNALDQVGLTTGGPMHDTANPPALDHIIAGYRDATRALADKVRPWGDALDEPVNFYRRPMPRGYVLGAFLLHQAHHRGQMTVLMRQAGLRVPGVYGPAREDWASMGMPALP
jgi:uncharacterized damage-inducible protein DinB